MIKLSLVAFPLALGAAASLQAQQPSAPSSGAAPVQSGQPAAAAGQAAGQGRGGRGGRGGQPAFSGPAPSGAAAVVENIGSMDRGLPERKLIRNNAPHPQDADKGYPVGFQLRESVLGKIVVDPRGMTIYARNGARGGAYGSGGSNCIATCAEKWRRVPAAPDAKPIGAWRIATTPEGNFWSYGNGAVYTYVGDTVPGQLNGHEFEEQWFAINFIPPRPAAQPSPPNVSIAFVEGTYLMADKDGRMLFTYPTPAAAKCGTACDLASPFSAGAVSHAVGGWTVVNNGDRSQWAYRGKPVYKSRTNALASVPSGALILRP